MTVQRSWGPQITIGKNPPIGHRHRPLTLGAASPPPYISGVNENPDAGPECVFAGTMLRDFRLFSSPDGNVGLIPGGYPAQDFGFLMSAMGLTIDFTPMPSAMNNIAEAQGTLENRPLHLRPEHEESHVRMLREPYRVHGFRHHVIPRGVLQIEHAPRYHRYGTSGALQAWLGNAVGRGLVIHNLNQVVDVHGFDMYGFRIHERMEPGQTHTRKCYKWVMAIVASETHEGANISVGTSDIFELPLRADSFCDILVWWYNHLVTSPTGFTPADTRFPHEPEFGSVRGTYQVQSPPNGTARLQVRQAVRAVNSDTVEGTFGVPMFDDEDEFWIDTREGGPGLESDRWPFWRDRS